MGANVGVAADVGVGVVVAMVLLWVLALVSSS